LSINNLFNNQGVADITGEQNATSAHDVLYTPGPQDTLELLPGRSVMLTVQLGFSPKER
jgi:iron complex outermembrane recepter protein